MPSQQIIKTFALRPDKDDDLFPFVAELVAQGALSDAVRTGLRMVRDAEIRELDTAGLLEKLAAQVAKLDADVVRLCGLLERWLEHD